MAEDIEEEPELEERTPTGNIVSKRDSDWMGQFLDNLINFFKNLLNL